MAERPTKSRNISLLTPWPSLARRYASAIPLGIALWIALRVVEHVADQPLWYGLGIAAMLLAAVIASEFIRRHLIVGLDEAVAAGLRDIREAVLHLFRNVR